VSRSRFIFLASPRVDGVNEQVGERVTWLLISPNHRPLGRAGRWFDDLDSAYGAVAGLREPGRELRVYATASPARGHWQWRVEAGGEVVAVATRTYLRQNECDYNVQRFLEAVPVAEVTGTVRVIRAGQG
jgi:hypothetical protein